MRKCVKLIISKNFEEFDIVSLSKVFASRLFIRNSSLKDYMARMHL